MSRILVIGIVLANFFEGWTAPTTYDQQQTGDLNVQVDLKDIQIVALLDSGLLEDLGEYDYAYDYSDFTIKPITPLATTAKPDSSGSSSTSIKPWHTWPTIPASSSTTEKSKLESESEEVQVTPVDSHPSVQPAGEKKNDSSSSADENRKVVSSTKPEDPIALIVKILDDPESQSAIPKPQTTPTNTEAQTNEGEKVGKVEKVEKVETEPAASAFQSPASKPEDEEKDKENNSESVTSANQPEVETQRKCSRGRTRDQKGRCVRIHGRRRIPAALLPFGIRLAPKVQQYRDHPLTNLEN